MANPAPTINQINAFNATQGTTIDFNIIGGTELVRSNRIYIYDLSDNSLICTHLYVSTESIHELPPNTDSSIVYESGKSSADFVNNTQYYAQIQTFTDIAGTEGGSGLSVAKMFWCLVDPTLTITTIPSTISTTSYNVSATYNANTSVVSNIIQQYQFNLYNATGSLLQSSGVVVGNGTQQGTSTAYDISYNFSGLSVGSSYYVTVEVTTTQGMSVSAQSGTFTVSIDTPTLGEATVVNNACDGYISVTSNLSGEYGGSGSGDFVSFETDSENVFTKLQVALEPTQSGSGTPSPSNVRPIYGVRGVEVDVVGKNLLPFSYAENTIIRNGITWTVNDDGTITANGTSTGASWFDIITASNIFYPKRQVIVSGCPSGGSASTYRIYINVKTKQGGNAGYTDIGSSSVVLDVAEINQIRLQINSAGFVANNLTFKPMIRYASEADSTYEPYQKQTVSEQFNVSLTPTSTDTDPYLFKAVGDIYGDRLEEELVGGSVNWNQLAKDINSTNYQAESSSHVTSSTISDGEFTFTSDAAGFGVRMVGNPYIKNKKFLVILSAKGASSVRARVLVGGSYGAAKDFILSTSYAEYTGIVSTNEQTTSGIYICQGAGTTGIAISVNKLKIVDLTAFFGSATLADAIYAMETANAGDGVAFMRKYFPKLFTADYNTGTLKSVNPTAHVTRGVNVWDEEWEVGAYNTTTGETSSSSTQIRCKNYISIIPSTSYYVAGLTSGNMRPLYYDANKNFIGVGYWQGGTSNNPQTTPANAYYMRFYLTSTEGTTYKGNLCINISDPTINGKYFPYEEHTYDLGDVTLRGIPKLVNNELVYDGDIYTHDGAVTRKYGVVTFDGAETGWQWVDNFKQAYISLPANAKYVDADHIPNIVCKLKVVAGNNRLSNIYNFVALVGGGASIAFSAPNCDTLEQFKTWASNNNLTAVYELATPTTETTTPFEQIQEVSKYGTLEYITTNDVPVGHNTTYLTRDVFGGTDDLISGGLTVDRKLLALGSLEWTYLASSTLFYAPMPNDAMSSVGGGDVNALCSCYERGRYSTLTNNQFFISDGGFSGAKRICVRDTRYTDATQFKNAMNGQTALYTLETPLTYQLTPQQIQTLVGTNNVWSEQGNIELAYHIPITNLLVKRQDVDDVSGNWLTLYSQPITQASDMDFTFIDFLNQYGKTYKYALVPLLIQTQSGVEVEVEGGYTVSDEVQSIFDGVFISDSTGLHKCKANVGYGNVNMNQSVGSITPIGSQYPIIVTNSNNRYHNGSISGMIVPDDYYYNGNLSRIDMVNKRNELEQFLTNKRAKIIKDWNSNIWLVMIMDNIDCSFDNNYGMGIVTFNVNWLEIGDPTNQEDLQATGLVDVGGV